MKNKVRVIQLGKEDFSQVYDIHPNGIWLYEPDFIELPKEEFELVIIDRDLSDTELFELLIRTKVGALYVLEDFYNDNKNAKLKDFFEAKLGKHINKKDLPRFLSDELKDFFAYQYGEKFHPDTFCVAFGFDGKVSWNGELYVTLSGDFGKKFKQIGYWRNNIPIEKNQTLEFFLEYEKDDNIELAMDITVFAGGKISKVLDIYHFSQKELENIVFVTNKDTDGIVFVSLKAKGEGALKIKALHDRVSRNGKSFFIPGGERIVTKKREEIFYYFNPGDLKPPLNVYFSGYKTMESFEGYNIMKKMGGPFLLISEARLKGGAFYIGDKEYEDKIWDIIESIIFRLGFNRHQVIMSGLSMGSFGALYYGSLVTPHTILVGKPLVNLGDIARNEHINRPGIFPTSIDIAKKAMEEKNLSDFDSLNKYFWDAFDKANFSKTNFAIAYMIEDDYDINAYKQLQEHLNDSGVTIYGKGIHGRHNDATREIIKWFLDQFEMLRK